MRYINPLRGISALVASLFTCAFTVGQVDPNSPGIIEPCLTTTMGFEVRIPNSDQADADELLNVVGKIISNNARGATSLTGHVIEQVESPNRDLEDALQALEDAADDADQAAMAAQADEIMAILLGTTQGRFYDGFAHYLK